MNKLRDSDHISISATTAGMEPAPYNISANTHQAAPEPEVPYWDVVTRSVLALFIATVIITAIIGNILVIMVIANNRGMRTRTNVFLCNLAVADLACAVFDMPVSMVTIAAGRWVFNDVVCQLNGFATPLFLITSIHTLMYMSVHKYISIKRPFSDGLSRRCIYAMVGVSWLWSACAGFVSLYGLTSVSYKPYTAQCGPVYPHNARTYLHIGFVMVTCFCVPFAVMLFCYGHVFREMRAHSKRMEKNSSLEKDAILSQQKRITCTLLLVLLMFVICWIPYILYALYIIIAKDKTRTPTAFNPLSYLFGYTNSAVNPILYALRSPAFREGYKQIACMRSTTAYRDKEYQTDFLSRRVKSMRSYLPLTVARELYGSEAGSVSLLTSRITSMSKLFNTTLITRRRLSTSSLPNMLSTSISRQSDMPRKQCNGKVIFTPNTYIEKWLQTFKERMNTTSVYAADTVDCSDVKGSTNKDEHLLVAPLSQQAAFIQQDFTYATDDAMVWDEEVLEARTPPVYAAQVSLTPCVMFNVATHCNANYEMAASPAVASAEIGSFENDNDMENVIRKTSRRRRPVVGGDDDNILDPDGHSRSKKTSNGVQLDTNSDRKIDQHAARISQSKSEPFLEEHKHLKKNRLTGWPKKVKHASSDSNDDHADFENAGDLQISQLQRYPSVERLDNVPSNRVNMANIEDRSGYRVKIISPKKKKKKCHNPYLAKNSCRDMSWFLRENKHGKVNNQQKQIIAGGYHSYLNKSVSDPCLTLDMIEQRILNRLERTCTARKKKHFEESSPGYGKPVSRHVEFTIGEQSDNCNENSRNSSFENSWDSPQNDDIPNDHPLCSYSADHSFNETR